MPQPQGIARLTLLFCSAWLASIGSAHATKPTRDMRPLLVIAGASGQTGQQVLAQAPISTYRIRALSSDLARARQDLGEQLYQRAEWREVDVRDRAAVFSALEGAGFVISAIGAREWEGSRSPQFIDHLGNVNLIEAARAAKVQHFVMLSSASAGSHKDQSQSARLGRVLYWKTLAEEQLKTSGLAYTIIGSAGLLNAPAGVNAIQVVRRADYVSTNVARGDVARVAIDALRNPDADGKSFALFGDRPGDPQRWRAQLRALPRDRAVTAAAPSLEQLRWMIGHWRGRTVTPGSETVSEELWMEPSAGLMLGLNREVRSRLEGNAAPRVSFEFLRIVQRPDAGVVYVAQPGGQSPTEFRLVSSGERRAVFSNPQHDFPQTLTYWRDGESLRARAEGIESGKPLVLEYQWQRAGANTTPGGN